MSYECICYVWPMIYACGTPACLTGHGSISSIHQKNGHAFNKAILIIFKRPRVCFEDTSLQRTINMSYITVMTKPYMPTCDTSQPPCMAMIYITGRPYTHITAEQQARYEGPLSKYKIDRIMIQHCAIPGMTPGILQSHIDDRYPFENRALLKRQKALRHSCAHHSIWDQIHAAMANQKYNKGQNLAPVHMIQQYPVTCTRAWHACNTCEISHKAPLILALSTTVISPVHSDVCAYCIYLHCHTWHLERT